MKFDTMMINNRSNNSFRSGWDHDQFDSSAIEDHLRKHKPFLNRGYRLSHLSTELGVPRHVVSKMINREYGMNFNRLINKMRIEYLQNEDIVAERDLYTLEAIARSYGFNSRTSFIKSFKLVCGSTPSVYFRKATPEAHDPRESAAQEMLVSKDQ
jgi:AraC-like DNA-binding protein